MGAFIVKYFAIIGPLFAVRDFFAGIIHDAAKWITFKKVTYYLFIPYYVVMDWIFGKQNQAFTSIENSIPWFRLSTILCSVKEDYDRNKLMASLDFIYPISVINSLADKERETITVSPVPDLIPEKEIAQTNGFINDSQLPRVIDSNHNLWLECRYAVEYATYAYFMDILGFPADVELVSGPFMPKATSDDTFEPGYFISFDANNERLVLCIRGSSTIGDFGTDIDARPTDMIHVNENVSYSVHRGIWLAARRLDARIKDTVIHYFNEYKKQHPNLELVITGHSLGAGVTSLLGIIWYYGLTDGMSESSSKDILGKFYCYSFASPPVIDEDGRNYLLNNMKDDQGRHVITSIANQMDIVTRMSIPGLFDASNKIEWIGKSVKNFDLLYSIVQKRRNSDGSWLNWIQYLHEQSNASYNANNKDANNNVDIDKDDTKTSNASNNSATKPQTRILDAGNLTLTDEQKKKLHSMNSSGLYTSEEISFIIKFIQFCNPKALGLPQKVIDNQNEHQYDCLYPCGLILWRMPRLPWNEMQQSYDELISVINWGNFVSRPLCYLTHMWNDMFGKVDINGNFPGAFGDGKFRFTHYDIYQIDGKNDLSKNDNMFNIFRNMVINTGVAVMNHAQGQYTATFGINLSTVFKRSGRYWVKWLPHCDDPFIIQIVKCMVALKLCAISYVWTHLTALFRGDGWIGKTTQED